MNEQIVILDFGSQYTQVIARRIRECKVYSTIVHYNTPATAIAEMNASGIILSGGPSSVYAKDAPLPDKAIFKLGIPILGICFGLQVMAKFLKGKVERGQKREYGKGSLRVKRAQCRLFDALPRELQVWNSHGDKLTKLPDGFKAVATTENSGFAAIENVKNRFYGLQFHPEVVHTPRGKKIISNFVRKICDCGRKWTMRSYVEQAVEKTGRRCGSLGNSYGTGNVLWAAEFLADNGTVSRVLQRGQGTVSGHQIFRAQAVRRQGVADAPKNGVLVGAFSQFRKVFGNSDARHIGANFIELATVCVGGAWLHVKRVHMAGPAGQPHVDSRLGFTGNGARLGQA